MASDRIGRGYRDAVPDAVPDAAPADAAQSKYQVRFAWGADGARRIGVGAHLLVWVDALADPATGSPEPQPEAPGATEVMTAGLGAATDVADRVTRLQTGLGDRCVVAVVAAGPAFAAEDLLAAGEVIDGLAAAGIDHSSPEAAVACAAYTGLRRAVRHLVGASENGVALARREQTSRA
jgi:hypothetical protein